MKLWLLVHRFEFCDCFITTIILVVYTAITSVLNT